MKNVFLIALAIVAFISCKDQNTEEDLPAVNEEQLQEMASNTKTESQQSAFMNYGAPVTMDGTITAAALEETFKTLKAGDTIPVKVRGIMEEVCVNKGCWANLKMNTLTASVKFKDYGFFVPKNAAGKEAIFSGVAFKSETSVADLRHYAEDAGKSKKEIAAITKPEITLSILADGALVERFENPDVIIPKKKTN